MSLVKLDVRNLRLIWNPHDPAPLRTLQPLKNLVVDGDDRHVKMRIGGLSIASAEAISILQSTSGSGFHVDIERACLAYV